MSDLRPTGEKLKLGDKEYGLRFTLNAIDDIQEHFDIEISNLSELFKEPKKQIKNLRYLLTLLINENIDCENDENGENLPHLDERFVGRQIDTTIMRDIIGTVYKAFSSHAPEVDEDSEVPNAKSE